MQARSNRLIDVLKLLQREFDQERSHAPGCRRGRIFQRLDAPTELLGFVEWDSQTTFDTYRSSSVHQAILNGLDGVSHSRDCVRLISFERVLQRSEVTAGVIIDTALSESACVEAFITGTGRDELIASPGLISHEVYRTRKYPPSFVVMHRWRRVADLARVRANEGIRHETMLTSLGARTERFTSPSVATHGVR